MNVYGKEITLRKRVEEELRQREEDLSRAQAVAHLGSWRMNIRSNVLQWSREVYRLFGIPAGTPLTYETFLAKVDPDDRDRVNRNWSAASSR